MNIVVIGVLPSSLVNFRGELLKHLSSSYSVTAMGSGATELEIREIEKCATAYVDYKVARTGLNPISDSKTLIELYRKFRKSKPEIVLAYTIKPIVWGGIASRLVGVKQFYALVTGLGYAFQPGGFVKSLLNITVKFLYRTALKGAKAVIFQNVDNMKAFIEQGIVPESKCHVVNGSGVDLSHFKKEPLPQTPCFLLIARLLGDKGIREYAKAAKIVKQHFPNAEFHLVGPEDSSPDAIKIEEVESWQQGGYVKYHGSSVDVRLHLQQASIFVLPSYHEGMPRTVLEAMAMGRPVLTTDVPGCRQTVVSGENGWLVEKENVEQLVERMIWYIEHKDKWEIMGDKGYKIASDKFDVHTINSELCRIMGLRV
ncbi:glycosyltransferase family 4 protein [Vibrio splendidus]